MATRSRSNTASLYKLKAMWGLFCEAHSVITPTRGIKCLFNFRASYPSVRVVCYVVVVVGVGHHCRCCDGRDATQAGTGCGGCEPMVKDIFAFAMKSSGKEVSTDICEHFKYTRQELYDIVRVREREQ